MKLLLLCLQVIVFFVNFRSGFFTALFLLVRDPVVPNLTGQFLATLLRLV